MQPIHQTDSIQFCLLYTKLPNLSLTGGYASCVDFGVGLPFDSSLTLVLDGEDIHEIRNNDDRRRS